MSNIDKQALREELSNPAIGSKDHLRKLALSLLDELEHYKSREERVTKLVLDNSTSWDALYKKLEAAEKRIAEQREYYEGVIADGSKRIAELERSETQLINERDSAESALNDAYKAVMGQAPEWSNWFSFENAIDEIELACEQWRNQTDDVIQFRQRIQELEREKPLMVDAMHVAVVLNSAGINLNDFDNCVSRLHEWGGLPDYCVALYLDYIHGVVSENKLLDFGYISDNGVFSTRQRIAELEAREIKPAKGEVLVVVSGFTGCGKIAIAGEIEIAMKAIGVPVQWTNGDAEKHMTGADWLTAIEMYKPTVRIVEVNVPRTADIKVKES
ncbi:ead/Ea22-like family protein [Salmonella enterica subsp. enterica serovar Oranienburg]|nr:ead/Ea22-like family protein [Salmonella enterica subsp. enterica serovar Oranienburg]EDW6500193.1 ead/Ea22-like family protein [Salmonella enterica subsp. enterica serovar Oranienburg]